VDDFIPTEEFLDFKKIEWEDIPDEWKKELEAMRRWKIEFVK
jgi:hypothetical protein